MACWRVMLTTFDVLAQPIRRSILDRLRDGEHLVGDLADALGLRAAGDVQAPPRAA